MTPDILRATPLINVSQGTLMDHCIFHLISYLAGDNVLPLMDAVVAILMLSQASQCNVIESLPFIFYTSYILHFFSFGGLFQW